ncbi:MAG: type II toxin-antitoxin system VapC family toxin [Candidatus Dormibacteria bacterium]
MTYLLDTHIWLWMLAAPQKLGARVRDLVTDSDNRLVLSVASSWEIAIKYGVGRLALPERPALFVPKFMDATGVRGLPIEHRHALAVAELPMHHRDPFDRILVAQAQLEGMALVTADTAFDAYDLELVRASG